MKIVLIGSGNVATHLGKAFRQAGHQIIQVYSRNLENASVLAGALGSSDVDDFAEISDEADIYIIALKDDIISTLHERLSLANKVIVHTSGSVPMVTLKPISSKYGVLYPLQTFLKDKELDIASVPFCIEGVSEDVENMLSDLAKELSENVQVVNSEQRQIVHLAAVFACNFSNHMYAIADDLLKNNGMNLDLLRPLIKVSSANLDDADPVDLQTGPAARGDSEIMDKHLEMLERNESYRKVYEDISNSIMKSRD
ncbi:MAG: DUF2520 domain-containing protein [Bacteroidia bacterium]|nr:DUF2520 domain-containing protein [Bacteroidia bacterium]